MRTPEDVRTDEAAERYAEHLGLATDYRALMAKVRAYGKACRAGDVGAEFDTYDEVTELAARLLYPTKS